MTTTSHQTRSPEFLDGKIILVTGGTGSFGRSFAKHVIHNFRPEKLIIFSRDEDKQVKMANQAPFVNNPAMRFFIGDVRDKNRLELAMRDVDYVVHAAALKHVPVAEYNPFECIRTNIYGAENVVTAALRTGVKRVIALSTDKAANPVNLYGASKLASDKIFVAANALAGRASSRFSVVRYGNVLRSRGSVVLLFEQILREGKRSLPITDARMTRFWITLEQGVTFVLSCLQMMAGGEIFVPKIPSMRIVDLASAMAPGMPHHIVGIRPGEKIHEVMIPQAEARSTLELPDRYIVEPAFNFFNREWKTPYRDRGASAVSEDFCYASDTNDHWLDGAALLRLLETG